MNIRTSNTPHLPGVLSRGLHATSETRDQTLEAIRKKTAVKLTGAHTLADEMRACGASVRRGTEGSRTAGLITPSAVMMQRATAGSAGSARSTAATCMCARSKAATFAGAAGAGACTFRRTSPHERRHPGERGG